MIFHDCMPVLLSTGCLSVRCPLAVYPAVHWLFFRPAVHWLFVRPAVHWLSARSLSTDCPFAVHWLSVLLFTICLYAVHCMAVYPADQWLFVRSLSTNCLSVRCPLAVRSLCTGWLSVRCLGRISIRQLHVIARISTLQQYTSTF